MSLPGPLRLFGKKHVEVFGKWIPALATYGGVTSLGILYITDWKVVSRYIPFYGSKFEE